MGQSLEFSRRIPLNRLGNGLEEKIVATSEERAALAKRYGIPEVHNLECQFVLSAEHGKTILAKGRLSAKVTQVCVITAEKFDDVLAEDFVLRFVPESEMPEDEFDIDSIDLEAPDEVPHDGKAIDLGEAAAEQLALMLDPYPRKTGAGLKNAVDVTPPEGEEDTNQFSDDVESERRPNPFSALAALKNGRREE
ncbi:DUF177 domain-containing protein [Swingsia samuiensis]|uniref:DUF177 domain-containing protein n=1 Tax=Swingsia samuiensis TaxID=1293412 RepID=A0A4Y6UGW2_9PROT|nr:DUF177 domain-containing protein [Swingsia samuiensis]QDH16234.1 DUF177 domain-containing protein [Swingsia samuiensis]